MSTPVRRVLIADNHDVIRRGLKSLLETRPNVRVVGEASTGLLALELARATSPDIVIIDYFLPELNGRDLSLELRRVLPEIEILIYTMNGREELLLDVLHAGARGFVLKSDGERQLVSAIDALSLHRPYFSDSVSETILGHYLKNNASGSSGSLTHREREVVQLIAEGKINKEVAHLLSISIKTVETHRASAMQKLKLRTTAELVRYAVRNHIVEP